MNYLLALLISFTVPWTALAEVVSIKPEDDIFVAEGKNNPIVAEAIQGMIERAKSPSYVHPIKIYSAANSLIPGLITHLTGPSKSLNVYGYGKKCDPRKYQPKGPTLKELFNSLETKQPSLDDVEAAFLNWDKKRVHDRQAWLECHDPIPNGGLCYADLVPNELFGWLYNRNFTVTLDSKSCPALKTFGIERVSAKIQRISPTEVQISYE